jgi:putative membrane-bound dehydrogenase-like protein
MIKVRLKSLSSILLLTGCVLACVEKKEDWAFEYAANNEVADYMKNFEGRGAVTDSLALPLDPKEALQRFDTADDLDITLVLAEPAVSQPVELNFDHKGRLWVVQYNQYPYPKGLKITSIDNHTRVLFDKTPEAPPDGVKGADKITFFEDTNGDGVFDKSTDAITGLNITTSVNIGRGRIWVLTPPYLISYPDANDDGIPDGDPKVHASGFGLEDTHAVANSLTWGPDGWLYGVQGSTTTASITTSASKNIDFLGQAVWRFHPESEVFELFAEGGGNNPFNLEFDSKGRIFSGSNGSDRGPYYKQGGYYIKSWGKHGPLTNPYAFGVLPNMPLEGKPQRFTHGLVRYEANSLPERYHGKLLAINPLHNYLQVTRLEPLGSSFRAIDEGVALYSDDKWFRPIDIKTGPDGNVYLTDWYDSRLTHVDPRDTWHKSSGRIYRIGKKGGTNGYAIGDLSRLSIEELIQLLAHENKWYRQQAIRILGDRRDKDAIPILQTLLNETNGQLALEALWALNLSGGLDERQAVVGLAHQDPFVRAWTIRLLGDRKQLSEITAKKITDLSLNEVHTEVISQLTATAKRLPPSQALPIIENLLQKKGLEDDPDIPMQLWWAVEQLAGNDNDGLLTLFENKGYWKNKMVSQVILTRLAQRWIMSDKAADYNACERLLSLAITAGKESLVVDGIMEGLRGIASVNLPESLKTSLNAHQNSFGNAPLTLAVRQGDSLAIESAIQIIQKTDAPLPLRLAYISLFGEVDIPNAVPSLLSLVQKDPSSAIKQASIHALESYSAADIGEKLAAMYPTIRADEYVREAAIHLFSVRKDWALAFFREVEESRTIHTTDVPYLLARKFLLLSDTQVSQKAKKLWPKSIPWTADDKKAEIQRVSMALTGGKGDSNAGRQIFQNKCLSCHRYNSPGGIIGPDLTGYDLQDINYLLLHVIDPNASIREGYETFHFETTDGRTLEGKIGRKEGTTLQIQTSHNGKTVVLPENRLRSREILQWSTMPEGLLTGLSNQEIKNLVAFLTE